MPWETIVPSAWFVAAAVCWYDPQLGFSIAFMMVGFTYLFMDSLATYFTKPAVQGMSAALTDALNTFASEENSEQADLLFDALTETISKALQSHALVSTLKHSFAETLQDDELQQVGIDTLQSALIKASENDEFQETALNVTKKAFIAALSNEAFVKELMESVVNAIVMASQDEQLTKSILGVVTQAVSEALADDDFTSELRGAVKDALRDGDIYRAGATGMISAAFGRPSKGAVESKGIRAGSVRADKSTVIEKKK